MHASRTYRSHAFSRQLAGLLHPIGKPGLVELVVLVDVEVISAKAASGFSPP
jgi:hypothetical protein